MHRSRLLVSDLDGAPVQGATILVAGHMPGHVHGLPTQPRVTQELAPGVLVEGLKFQMEGWWVMEFRDPAARRPGRAGQRGLQPGVRVRPRGSLRALVALGLALALQSGAAQGPAALDFSAADINFLRPFTLDRLPPPPPALSNAWADDLRAATLGQQLFFDTRLSADGRFACASCHQPRRHFTDGLPRAMASGSTRRGTPSVLGAAYSPWLNWDGGADSLWAQALGPIEHPAEMATPRSSYVGELLRLYPQAHAAVFGRPADLPPPELLAQPASPLGDAEAQRRWAALPVVQQQAIDRIFSQAGKALMAYQRRLRLAPARFDRFVDALARGIVPRRAR